MIFWKLLNGCQQQMKLFLKKNRWTYYIMIIKIQPHRLCHKSSKQQMNIMEQEEYKILTLGSCAHPR